MGCLSNLNRAILHNCDGGASGIDEMLLINASEVASKFVSVGVVTIALASGGKAILVESNKKGVNTVEAVKTNDNAPTMLAQTVTFTIYTKTGGSADTVNRILNGRFLALTKMKERGIYRAYGVNFGLECTGVDEDANANGGYTTITIATPETVFGEQRLVISEENYNTLRASAIVA